MKSKFLFVLLIFSIFMTGCAAKSAEQHGNGISVEFDKSLGIKHVTIIQYVNDEEYFRENVINANKSPFEKGEVVWFDTAVDETNEFQLAYSMNINGTDPQLTNKLNISKANNWVNAKFTEEFKLEIEDME